MVYPPRRLWSDGDIPPLVELGVDANRVQKLPTPAELLCQLPENDNWSAQSKRSIARLFAYFLLCEDPQRRLDARQVVTLSHQVSLVRHILDHDHLKRVLIADEVGLGKTVEVGLLLKELMDQNPGLRVLYFAPARLVNNVGREFDRLELNFRLWKAGEADARLTDPRIIASIHRAVHGENAEKILNTPAWDVIVVDECHHLSDWSAGGGDPIQKFRLVRDLVARQSPESRLLLLSGTPHQGHVHRFDNLLGLLKRPEESASALSGRVIYRTKDDVRDWDGEPLFPTRQVNEPLVLDLGPEYRAWLQHIHDFYRPPKSEGSQQKARQRAAGWRCAQALQWAASSPQAGLGYLVRQAVRAGWKLGEGVLSEALAALRPYRNGSPSESVESLLSRIKREVNQQDDTQDVEDIEEGDSATAEQNAAQRLALNTLLSEGLSVLKHFGNGKWDFLRSKVFDHADGEKIVLFAQPIETVCALSRYLEQCTGQKPAIIIGGQSDAERQEQQDQFWRKDGPRFLVSSRAGGEGINLQVARRLIHVDDRGLLPDEKIARNAPVPAPSCVESPTDVRRIRCALLTGLRRAAQNGDALLSEAEALIRLSQLPELNGQFVNADWIAGHAEFIREHIVRLDVVLPGGNKVLPALQLTECNEQERKLAKICEARAGREIPSLQVNWKDLIKSALKDAGHTFDPQNTRHVAALDEQADVLERITTRRISTIVGRAGTGKTAVIGALVACEALRKEGILLLAPTGKARVRLGAATGAQAMTVAQFLNSLQRYDGLRQRPLFDGKVYKQARTVVIDEASMLTLDGLYALLQGFALDHVQRIILVGDPNQLPPIGVGRPFADSLHFWKPAPPTPIPSVRLWPRRWAG